MISKKVSLFLIFFFITSINATHECCLIESHYDLELLKSELSSFSENEYVHRRENLKTWQGLPLKNALGTTDKRGLEIGRAIPRTQIMKECFPTKHLERTPYIASVLDDLAERFETEVGFVRILKLPAGLELNLHSDGSAFNLDTGDVIRLHIPIATSPQVSFIINNKNFYFEEGKLYYANVSLKHQVINSSAIDRVHIVIDLKATPELREFIKNQPTLDHKA